MVTHEWFIVSVSEARDQCTKDRRGTGRRQTRSHLLVVPGRDTTQLDLHILKKRALGMD